MRESINGNVSEVAEISRVQELVNRLLCCELGLARSRQATCVRRMSVSHTRTKPKVWRGSAGRARFVPADRLCVPSDWKHLDHKATARLEGNTSCGLRLTCAAPGCRTIWSILPILISAVTNIALSILFSNPCQTSFSPQSESATKQRVQPEFWISSAVTKRSSWTQWRRPGRSDSSNEEGPERMGWQARLMAVMQGAVS
jgi:hypothetical protein